LPRLVILFALGAMKFVLIGLLSSIVFAILSYIGIALTWGFWLFQLFFYIGLAGVLVSIVAFFVIAKRKGRVSIFDNGERDLRDDEV
jgi:hypothetical protein